MYIDFLATGKITSSITTGVTPLGVLDSQTRLPGGETDGIVHAKTGVLGGNGLPKRRVGEIWRSVEAFQ
jgi:hypothetical protein